MSGKSKDPEQFRRDAVALARSSDRPLRQVARELGVNHETLRNWVRTAEQAQAAPQAGGMSAGERHRPEHLHDVPLSARRSRHPPVGGADRVLLR